MWKLHYSYEKNSERYLSQKYFHLILYFPYFLSLSLFWFNFSFFLAFEKLCLGDILRTYITWTRFHFTYHIFSSLYILQSCFWMVPTECKEHSLQASNFWQQYVGQCFSFIFLNLANVENLKWYYFAPPSGIYSLCFKKSWNNYT